MFSMQHELIARPMWVLCPWQKARQVATVKASSLELEMETAIRELALEKRKLQGARERIVLRLKSSIFL